MESKCPAKNVLPGNPDTIKFLFVKEILSSLESSKMLGSEVVWNHAMWIEQPKQNV